MRGLGGGREGGGDLHAVLRPWKEGGGDLHAVLRPWKEGGGDLHAVLRPWKKTRVGDGVALKVREATAFAPYAPAKGQGETKELGVAEVDLGVVEELGKTEGKRAGADAYRAYAAEAIHLHGRGRQAASGTMRSHVEDVDRGEGVYRTSDAGEVTEEECPRNEPCHPEQGGGVLGDEQVPDLTVSGAACRVQVHDLTPSGAVCRVRKSKGGAPAA